MCEAGNHMLNLVHIDHVHVDPIKQQVTVGAGATVSTILKELSKHGLTLQNFSSIQEQQIAGWTQVAAHGTGCTLPTVDEMILSIDILTPAHGTMHLSESSYPLLFQYAKVGLGCLGVVTELTLQCIPAMHLLEHTTVFSKDTIAQQHVHRLHSHRHVRYMWFPYTSTVVSVISDPSTPALLVEATTTSENNPTAPLLHLLQSVTGATSSPSSLSFTQLRDALLAHAPLDTAFIRQVNQAETAFWSRNQGSRLDDSTRILGFDCGGSQLVLEVCFPLGSLEQLATEHPPKDIAFVQKLLQVTLCNVCY